MSDKPENSKSRPLRMWPAILIVVAMVAMRFVPVFIEGGLEKYPMVAVMGPMICSLLLLLWWLFASRALWKERIFVLLGIVVTVICVSTLADVSMRGPGTIVHFTLPVGLTFFVVGAGYASRKHPFKRTLTVLLAMFLGCSLSLLVRTEGMSGNYLLGFFWRWTPTSEDQLLAEIETAPPSDNNDAFSEEISTALEEPEWPAFRGESRSGSQSVPEIETDWDAHPPEQLWKIDAGPSWASFAVAGDFLFTQEQRGTMETVVCYRADTGEEVWIHETETRFEESLGGPGPRSTPTLSKERLFVLGATGTLSRLDPASGEAVWQQDIQTVAERKPPTWGFASSPLVVDSVVIVYAGGEEDKGVLAFDTKTGDLAWSSPAGNHAYSSPQLNTILGEDLVLMLTNYGVNLIDPENGEARFDYEWKMSNGYRALQPKVIGDDTILLPTASMGTRAIRITKDGDSLSAEELWTSRNMKPDFNDFVIYDGNAYGFDGSIFACVDLETGDRQWKDGRYGKGQVLLLENLGLLLIAAESGEVVLLKADSAEHMELTSFEALENKTWNHPVVVGDRLYIRNSQEAAAYRLPVVAEK